MCCAPVDRAARKMLRSAFDERCSDQAPRERGQKSERMRSRTSLMRDRYFSSLFSLPNRAEDDGHIPGTNKIRGAEVLNRILSRVFARVHERKMATMSVQLGYLGDPVPECDLQLVRLSISLSPWPRGDWNGMDPQQAIVFPLSDTARHCCP